MNKKIIEGYATARYIRISPSKIRRILNELKGRSFNEAILILKFMPYKMCPIISKLLFSAVANAKNRYNLSTNNFIVAEARVDSGPVLKRFCPHAQGRGFPIKKRMSHIISFVFN
jgi:large subunit ribosomal protein L22